MTLPLLPDSFVTPNYSGGSLANIPATVASLLDAPFQGLPPLKETLWSPVAGKTKRVIVLLLDSLGWEIYRREREKLTWLTSAAAIEAKITTVFPSTTVAALSSIWTGYAPAQHGLVGLRLLFPDQAVLGQMLTFSSNFAGRPGLLEDGGVDPESFLAVPGFGQHLAAAGSCSLSLSIGLSACSPLNRKQ